MIRTRIRTDQEQDLDFLSESELNDFFDKVVITGTLDPEGNIIQDSEVLETFDDYFPGRGLIVAGSGIIVTTGTQFVQIDATLSGSGITLEEHETIDSLVHNLAETSTTEIIRNVFGQVTDVDVRTTPVTGTLIRSTSITRNIFGQVTTVVENQHDENGAIIQTLTSTINRTAGIVTSVDTVET